LVVPVKILLFRERWRSCLERKGWRIAGIWNPDANALEKEAARPIIGRDWSLRTSFPLAVAQAAAVRRSRRRFVAGRPAVRLSGCPAAALD
jgi:hypothetical protein